LPVNTASEKRNAPDDLSGQIFGIPSRWIEDQAAVSSEIKSAIRSMLDLIIMLKGQVREIDPPPLWAYRECVSLLTAFEGYRLNRRTLLERYTDYSDVIRR